jgi:serine O-acetyltransferase
MEEQFEAITSAILGSYQLVGGINHIDGTNLPSKPAIAAICEDLLELLFPGFHDEGARHSTAVAGVTAQRVRSIWERLEEEVCKSLRIVAPECPRAKARAVLERFMGRIPALREVLKTDVEAAFEGDPAAGSFEEIIVAYPFLEAVAIQRVAHGLYGEGLPLIPRIMTEWAHSRTGIDIHPGAKIGTHFFIDHGTGTVVGETCQIGNRVKLYQSVALIARSLSGGQTLRGKKRHPTIGDGVTLYAGSTVMGGDTVIGEGSTIGANVFLTHSIPPRSLVYYEEKQLRIVPKRSKDEGDVNVPPV